MWRLLNSLLLLLLLLAVGQEGRIARLAPPAAAIPTSSRSVAAVNATADNSSAVAAVNLTSSTAVNNATTVPAAYDAAAQSNPLDNLDHKDLSSLFRSAAAISSTPTRDKATLQVSSLVGQFVPGFAYPNPAGLPTTGPYGGPVQQWPVRTQQQQQLPGSWPPPPAQQLPGYLGGPQQQLPFGFPLPGGSTSPVLLGGQPRMAADVPLKDGLGQFMGAPPASPYQVRYCDVTDYPRCSCIHPALYSEDGRGNCNVGASKMDLRVWCYVDDSQGPPAQLCPDAVPSVEGTNRGRYWSRMACITP